MQRNWKKLDTAMDFIQATSKTVADKSVQAGKAVKNAIPEANTVLGKLGLQLKTKGPSAKVANVNNAVDAEFTMLDEFAGKNKEEVEAIIENKIN